MKLTKLTTLNEEEEKLLKGLWGIGFEFREEGKIRSVWSGVWIREGAPPSEIAFLLEELAAQIRAEKFGQSYADQSRIGNEINFEQVKDRPDVKSLLFRAGETDETRIKLSDIIPGHEDWKEE